MKVHRCTIDDLEMVDAILRHPSIYKMISDDGSPESNGYSARNYLESEHIYYLLIGDSALFMLHPLNSVCYQVHASVLPEGRGAAAVTACMSGVRWMWENSPAQKIIGIFPESNRKAYALCKRVGMVVEGLLAKSYQKHGKLIDQVIMGLCREE